MRTDHVQFTFCQAGNVIAMVDDAGMQPPMIFVIVADIHGCQNLASCPRSLALDHQHRARALTQKFPVTWRQQCLAQGVVRPVFLDHQVTAFSLLNGDDRLVQGLVPVLFMRDVIVAIVV
ncbi:hypothetical protein D3C79_762610 [compost metagenome]